MKNTFLKQQLKTLVNPEFISFFSKNFLSNENYKEQYESLKLNLNYLTSSIENLENDLLNLTNELNKNEKNIILKNVEINLLELLKNYKLESKKDFILNIINSALVTIFEDNIKIDIKQEVTKAGKIKYNIIFLQNEIEIGKNNELLETNGGGVLSIISFLFKILIGYLYSKNKFFIFDESFAQVSPQYREKLSLFLRNLSEQFRFTIVLVSQTEDLNTYAHVLYKVNYKYEKDIKTLFIQDRIERDVENINEYYFVKIKNFQSIKEIEFDYKGFTVISGPNNSGKSASLRAIKSIIFNDFKEKFQRINTKVTEIVFGKRTTNKILRSLKLIYKSKKVIYEINGEQYLGKNLAADVVKQEVEKIGFRYIDIKKLYKNIKGDLREQTEKIAYSSQHDSLFLIGNKSTDIEKVFNFLFNTEYITQAIIDIKEIISELNTENKYLNKNIEELNHKLKIEKEKLILFELYFQVLTFKLLKQNLIYQNEYHNQKSSIIKKIEKLDTCTSQYKNLYDKYKELTSNNYKSLLITQNELKNNYSKIKDTLNKLNVINKENLESKLNLIKQFSLLESLLQNNDKQVELSLIKYKLKIIENQNDLKNLYTKYKLNSIYDIINLFTNLQSLKDKINLITKYKTDLLEINNELKDFDNQVNKKLEEQGYFKCECCQGFGFHKKGENND